MRKIKTPCPHCGREEDGTWYSPCPSDDCPSREKTKNRFVKGSPEAKAHMAKLRALAAKKRKGATAKYVQCTRDSYCSCESCRSASDAKRMAAQKRGTTIKLKPTPSSYPIEGEVRSNRGRKNPVDYQTVLSAAQKVGYSMQDAARVASTFKKTGEIPTLVSAQLRYFSRSNPIPSLNPGKKADALDRQIEQAWYRLAHGVQVSVMDIPKIFRYVREQVQSGKSLDGAVTTAVSMFGANTNPRHRRRNPIPMLNRGDEDDEGESCSVCSGPLMFLGALGRLEHFRCRNCGMQFSRDAKGSWTQKELNNPRGRKNCCNNPRPHQHARANGFWMNASEVENAVDVISSRAPEYLPFAVFLKDWKDIVNENSDGWHSWPGGGKAAEKLMILVDSAAKHGKPSIAEMKAALAPIRSTATRRKLPVPTLQIHIQKKLPFGGYPNRGAKANPILQTVLLASGNPPKKGHVLYGMGEKPAGKITVIGVEIEPVKVTRSSASVVPLSQSNAFGVYFRMSDGLAQHVRDFKGSGALKHANEFAKKFARLHRVEVTAPRIRSYGNPGRAVSNPEFKIPWKVGQQVPVDEARKVVVASGNREWLKDFDESLALQTKANRKPTFCVWGVVPIGSKSKMDALTAMVHYGETDETYYKPPKGSKKGNHLYRHKWGEKKKRAVPLLVSPGGKALVHVLGPGQTAGDWLRG